MAIKKSGDELVTRNIGRLVAKYALASRSELYRWMHANYAQLKPVLTRPRPPWVALAKAAGEAGQKTEGGQDYSRQTLWKTWRQLHRDMEESVPTTSRTATRPSARQANPPVSSPSTAVPAASAGQPPDIFARDDDDEPLRPLPKISKPTR